MKLKLTASAIALAFSFSATAADLVTFTAGEAAKAAEVNSNFNAVAMDAAAAQTAADNAGAAATAAKTAADNAATDAATAQTTAEDAATAATAAQSTADMAKSTADTNATAIEANALTAMANEAALTSVQASLSSTGPMIVDSANNVVGEIIGQVDGSLIVKTADNVIFKTNMQLKQESFMNFAKVLLPADQPNPHPTMWYFESDDCTGDAFVSSNQFKLPTYAAMTSSDASEVVGAFTNDWSTFVIATVKGTATEETIDILSQNQPGYGCSAADYAGTDVYRMETQAPGTFSGTWFDNSVVINKDQYTQPFSISYGE